MSAAHAEVFLERVRPAGELEGSLSEDELRRCARYRHQADRDRYVSLRALLRQVLAERGFEEAECVREPSGRPRLSLPGRNVPNISLTKSGGWVGVALCAEAEVGLDLERLAAVDQPGFAGLVCTREEARALERMTAEARADEKLRLWTTKEALLKATGEGLLRDPRTVPVGTALSPGLQHLPDFPEVGMGLAVAIRKGSLV